MGAIIAHRVGGGVGRHGGRRARDGGRGPSEDGPELVLREAYRHDPGVATRPGGHRATPRHPQWGRLAYPARDDQLIRGAQVLGDPELIIIAIADVHSACPGLILDVEMPALGPGSHRGEADPGRPVVDEGLAAGAGAPGGGDAPGWGRGGPGGA